MAQLPLLSQPATASHVESGAAEALPARPTSRRAGEHADRRAADGQHADLRPLTFTALLLPSRHMDFPWLRLRGELSGSGPPIDDHTSSMSLGMARPVNGPAS